MVAEPEAPLEHSSTAHRTGEYRWHLLPGMCGMLGVAGTRVEAPHFLLATIAATLVCSLLTSNTQIISNLSKNFRPTIFKTPTFDVLNIA